MCVQQMRFVRTVEINLNKKSPRVKLGGFFKRVMGIEPTYLAWKASVLPLNYTRICPEPESNQRHEDFQSSALPTELSGPVASTTKLILHDDVFHVKSFRRDCPMRQPFLFLKQNKKGLLYRQSL